MKANFKSVLFMGQILLLGALCAGSFTACSDDDDPAVEQDPVVLVTPVKSGDAIATLNSLTFSWNAVTGASGYYYELKKDGNVVSSGTTTETSIYFSGLTAGTTYTLEVTAKAASGSTEYTDSQTLTLSGATLDYIQLEAPSPAVESQDGTSVVVAWSAVANADSYAYTVTLAGAEVASGETAETQVALETTEEGEYTLTVVALSANEQYTESEAGSVSFTYTAPAPVEAQVIWTAEGQISGGGYAWNITLAAYDDGTYALLSWYGNEGYDLKFSVDDNAGIVPTNAVSEGNDYYEIATGEGYTTWIYTKNFTNSRYSKFEGTQESGALYLWDNGVNDFLDFVWPVPEENTEEPSEETLFIDQLVGTYASSTIGGDYYNDDWSWRDDVSFENTVTITKQDDNTLLFGNFYMDGYTLTVNVDNETGVVTVPIQTIAEYYDIILYNHYSEDIEVEVGYDLETGTITIPKGGDYSTWTTWAMRYNGYQYAFYVTTLTKQ